MEDYNYITILKKVLRYSRERNYIGYDYGDGMSSKVLQKLPFENKWINLLFQETIKRAPINIRPHLFVVKRPNSKGTALFALANLKAFLLTEQEIYNSESERLLWRLIKLRKTGYNGFCLGSNHETQDLNRKHPIEEPDVVDTSYGVKAFLEASKRFKKSNYLENAYASSEFLFNDLDYKEIENGARIKYKPNSSDEHYTLNSNALGARLLIDLYSEFSEERFLDGATKILDYVVSNQSEIGGWMYRDPPSSSHLNMDNHHNGFIIESLLRYKEVTNSDRYDDALKKSLKFYKEVLHDEDGSPNWDEKSKYPKDIHASAQGIITFTEAGDLDFAKKILDWTLDNLYAGDGKFYYQKRKFYTKKFTLMRWCQAWMAHAIANYLNNLKNK